MLAVSLAIAAQRRVTPHRDRPSRLHLRPSPQPCQLQRDIEAVLAAPALDRSYLGHPRHDRHERATRLYSLNAGKLLMPGSTMKIVTLAAAAERLGWDYVVRHASCRRRDDRCGRRHPRAAIFVVVGIGDPSIVDGDGMAARLFAEWAERLKASGVRTITGRIIGDDNAFDDEALGPGWAWDDLPGPRRDRHQRRCSSTRTSAQATVAPGATVGAPAIVAFAPDGSDLDPRQSADNDRRRHRRRRSRRAARPAATGWSCAARSRSAASPIVRVVSVDNPTLFFVTALRNALIAAGIDVRGPAVDIDDLDGRPAHRTAGTELVDLPFTAAIGAGDAADEKQPEPVRGNAAQDDRRRRPARRRSRTDGWSPATTLVPWGVAPGRPGAGRRVGPVAVQLRHGRDARHDV